MSRIMAKAGRKTAKTARNSRPQPATEAMLPRQRRRWLLGGTGLITGSVVMAAASFLSVGAAYADCNFVGTPNDGVTDTVLCDAPPDVTGFVDTLEDSVIVDVDANVSNGGGDAIDLTVNPTLPGLDDLIQVDSIASGVTVDGQDDGMDLTLNKATGMIDIQNLLGTIRGRDGEALDLETGGANIKIAVGSTGLLLSDEEDAIEADPNGGDFILTSSGGIRGGIDAVNVNGADLVDVTNSSMASMVGDEDGLDVEFSNQVKHNNTGGLTAGKQNGIDLDEIAGDSVASAVYIKNTNGIIAGYEDAITIDDVWNGNVVIDNASGLILSVDGDGVDVVHADGNVEIDNSGTSTAAALPIEGTINQDISDALFSNVATHARGIYGDNHGILLEDVEGAVRINNSYGTTVGKYEDGIDLEDIDEYVFINNHYGSILGGDDGVDLEEIEGDYRIDKTGALVGEYSVVINNSAGAAATSYGIRGQDDGIDIETVEKGSIYINNYDGSIEGVDENGIKIKDTQARDGTKGNVEIDNNGGTVKGGDDGIEIEDIDGNVRIANGGGAAVGYGEILGTGSDGVDIDKVDDYVFIDNRGGKINGGDGDGVKIEDVDGYDLIDALGGELTTDKYAVVVLSASEITGTKNGVNIKDVKEGGVLVESGDGYGESNITGYDGDGVKIRDVDDGPVDVVNYGYSTIWGKDDGVYIKDTDGDDGEDVTVTNYAYGTIEGEYGSGIQVKDAEEDVRIKNRGDILGHGDWDSAVIKVHTKDGLFIDNEYGGVIQSNNDGFNWGDIAIKARTQDGTVINNWGTINGRVFLSGDGNNTFNNFSDNSWNVTGKNFFGWGDYDHLNNTGTINIDNWTGFFGLEKLYNAGGLISMHQYDYNGTDEKLLQKGDFIGKQGNGYASYLEVDTYFGDKYDPYADSDILKVKGDIKGSTEIIVHKANDTPGGINKRGIDVVEYKWGDGGYCHDYFCKEGDTFFISSLSPYYVNIGGYGAIEDGLYAWFLKHDYDHYDYEFVSKFGQGAAAAPGLVTGAQNIFYDTLRVVEDNKYGYQFANQGGGGADLPIEEPPVTSSSGGANAGLWVKAKGSWTERDTSVEENGLLYDTSSSQDIYSILGGADMKPWGDDSPVRIGLFGGYVTSNLDFDVGSPEADYEGGVLGAYAAYNNGAFYVDGTVKGDLLSTTYSFGGQEADADVTSIGGSLNTGYRMHAGRGFIEPIASLEFVHSSVDDFNNAGTTVDFSNGQSIRAGAGAKIGTNVATMGGSTTELSLLGKVWNEFEDANTVTVTGGGDSATFTDDISGVFGEVAATATIVSADGTSSGFISAGGQFGEDFMSFRAEAGLRKGF